MNIEGKIAKLIAYLTELYPAWKPKETTAGVYQDLLGAYSEEQLVGAARGLARLKDRSPYPSPGTIVEQIEGREVRVPIHQRDLWGAVPLDRSGSPSVVGWETVRVPAGATPPPHLLSWGDDENERLLGPCSIAPREREDEPVLPAPDERKSLPMRAFHVRGEV